MNSDTIFKTLKSFLKQYEVRLSVIHDTSDHYYVNTLATETNKKSEFFGAMRVKKSYVAFHLMPIYYYPELVDNLSPELKAKMQGKSCFNFKEEDDKLFSELKGLTQTGYEKYTALNKI